MVVEVVVGAAWISKSFEVLTARNWFFGYHNGKMHLVLLMNLVCACIVVPRELRFYHEHVLRGVDGLMLSF